MIVIIRSNEVNPDPRVQKYINYLEKKSIDYIILGWNRDGNKINKKNYIYFEKKAKYGLGVKNIPNKLLWFMFIIKYLIINRKEYNLVHACDFDTAFPSYVASLITKKKYIFDVFDWMSDDSKKGIFFSILRFLENYVAKKARYVIVCEEERKEQINIDKANIAKEDILVMPNIPNICFSEDLEIISKMNNKKDKYNLIISYVGVFDSDRGIEDILETVKNQKNIFLHIAGFGKLDELVKEYSASNDNIRYWGKVNYNTALNIMKQSDLILAMYYTTNPVHKYAAPNKFYEGLMLGVPIVTTKGTLVGNKTLKLDTGFVISEGSEPLKNLLTMNGIEAEILQKSYNAKIAWENIYKDAIDNFMAYDYSKIIDC